MALGIADMVPRHARFVQRRDLCYRRNADRYALETKAMKRRERSELIMRGLRLGSCVAFAVAAFVASGATQAQYLRTSARVAGKKTVNCSKPPYRNKIKGTLTANLEISVYPGVCVVTGRVKGNVIVRNIGRRCAKGADFVALSLKGGRIDGRVEATGKQCVMVWLYDGALVNGRIVYRAAGNLGFLGDHSGARVRANVRVEKGLLWATGASTTNRIDGNLVCDGGHPAGLARLATRTNWDGAGRDEKDETVDVDGGAGGRYLGCHRRR